ncbi:nucleotide-binding protein [Methanolacinia petrolearia]|uniref:nucleotide-binding protein n=1 Tax=Methanolacinia petrolearia TaxID=54120 RepID=UPI003BAB97D7
MDIDPQITERISLIFKEKGVLLENDKIESKLKLLTADFGIAPEEAEKMVTSELLREYGLNGPSQQSPSAQQQAVPIAGISPGDWVTVEGKIVSLSSPQSEVIAQSGILSDESGAIRFIVWAKSNAPLLEERKWYRFESATVDEYRGAPSMKIHSGTTITPIEMEKTFMPLPVPISALKPGVSTIRAKVMQDWEPRHERMFQSGLLGDESGTVRFVTWKDDTNVRLEAGKVYNIYYAGVDEFQGRLSMNLTGAMILEDEGADIEVASGDTKISGAFVHTGGGTGLIKRCKVEGCNRALSRQNYCPVHEIQNDFRYDLRITGVVDNGQKATNVLVQRQEAEKLTGISLEAAIETAENNPLGFDDVRMKMQEALLGRYVECKGSDIDGTLLVKSCSLVKYDSTRHADLINRASVLPEGGEQ